VTIHSRQNSAGGRDDWQTPACVLERVRRVAPIGLDPCTRSSNPVGARRFSVAAGAAEEDPEDLVDGLAQSWSGIVEPGELVYVNPPYSRGCLAAWTSKCREEARAGCEIIALVLCDTSTKWWHEMDPAAVCYWRGRLRFLGAPAPATFPSALVYWGARPHHFANSLASAGICTAAKPSWATGTDDATP
jgi:hypothetical protein